MSPALFFRVADDFYPNNAASHSCQIVACAYNSLLFRHVGACPDWDMFTTRLDDENAVRMHAIARCLSGGPIYISDAPNDKNDNNTLSSLPNPKVIEWISCSDGTTLPCREAAVPIRRCLLQDPLNGNEPLIICNTNGSPSKITSGVLGVFCVSQRGEWDPLQLDYVSPKRGINNSVIETKHIEICPADILDFSENDEYKRTRFLAVGFFSESVAILESPRATMKLALSTTLHPLEAVTLFPLITVGRFEFAALGLDGKINGAGSVVDVTVKLRDSEKDSRNCVRLEIIGCGTFVLAVLPPVNKAPEFVIGDNEEWICQHVQHHADNSARQQQLRDLGCSLIEFSVPSSSCESRSIEIEFE